MGLDSCICKTVHCRSDNLSCMMSYSPPVADMAFRFAPTLTCSVICSSSVLSTSGTVLGTKVPGEGSWRCHKLATLRSQDACTGDCGSTYHSYLFPWHLCTIALPHFLSNQRNVSVVLSESMTSLPRYIEASLLTGCFWSYGWKLSPILNLSRNSNHLFLSIHIPVVWGSVILEFGK